MHTKDEPDLSPSFHQGKLDLSTKEELLKGTTVNGECGFRCPNSQFLARIISKIKVELNFSAPKGALKMLCYICPDHILSLISKLQAFLGHHWGIDIIGTILEHS